MSPARAPLHDGDRRVLLDLARRAVAARLEGRSLPPAPAETPRLLQPQGAFVTLTLLRQLRGCIGMIRSEVSLAETVIRCAAAAAAEDPRFPPLSASELDLVRIEISALEPPFRIEDPASVTLGRHGLIVTLGRRRGLLLPQVAMEHGLDLNAFLEETCLKAGLPPDAWRRGALLEAFEAEVFREPD